MCWQGGGLDILPIAGAAAMIFKCHGCVVPTLHMQAELGCLLQHVHTQEDAVQEMEELINLDSYAMARRTNVRTRL